MFTKLSPVQRSLISAVIGFCAYGAWSYLVNSMYGWQAGLKAGCVQGGYSFVLTFIMTLCIESLFNSVANKTKRQRVSIFLTVVIVCLFLYSSSWFVNVLAGTPEILNTVILGYIVGTVYTCSYTIKLAKTSTALA